MAQTNQSKQAKLEVPGYLKISKVIVYALYFWVTIGIISLVLRVFLLAFSANPATPFVRFIYETSTDYMSPFRGIFSSRAIGDTGYLDVAAMFAIIVYLFVMWGFSSLIRYVQYKIDQSINDQQTELLNRQKANQNTRKR